jgi:hypothetical protein
MMAHEHSAARPPLAEWVVPSRWSSVVFSAKALAYRTRRLLVDLAWGPRRLFRSPPSEREPSEREPVIAECSSPLWPDARPEEQAYQLGKVHNLRRAAALLDGIVVPAGAIFSFWKQIGRASRRRGFVTGRMLQQGCLVPAAGGGLCQLSNALYEAALNADCEIVERHAHSRRVAGSAAALGRDATVAWNYVDLRFRPRSSLRLAVRLTRDELVVRFHGKQVARPPAQTGVVFGATAPIARSCATCGDVSCFRHEHHTSATREAGHDAFLVDENWPEFREYVTASRQADDVLGLPLNCERWRIPRYSWPTAGFTHVGAAALPALRRALAIRRAPTQGAARRLAELCGAEQIAKCLAKLLTPDVTRICVAQSLLPYLWRDGHLGGREVEVLMTRLPMSELHARLDRAVAAHPERATLGDFRAVATLVEAEDEALAYASRVVTPHAEIALLYSDKVLLLPWKLPAVRAGRTAPQPRRIAFPGPTIARKGAYALREAARVLGLEIVLLGRDLEGQSFWDGIATSKPPPDADWLDGVAAVVQPAIVEERPRHLLAALAAGIPVIASAACGLADQAGVTTVPANDPAALVETLRSILPPAPCPPTD